MALLVYGLVDPRTTMVRYIGKSESGLARPRQHAYPSNRRKALHSARWIDALVRVGLTYTITVLETCTDRVSLCSAEIWWIAFGRACGWPLTNITSGGEGGRVSPLSARGIAAIRDAHTGRIKSESELEKIRAAATGVIPNDVTRAKMSASHKNRKHTDESREAIRRSHLGKKASASARENMRRAALAREATKRGARCL